MIEIVDTSPNVDVLTAEYTRLLGYPRNRVLEDRALELAEWARGWYGTHGRPWIYARQAGAVDISRGTVEIDGVPFTSARLLKTLRDAAAESVVLVATGAGPELEAEAHRLWQDGRPDEYFFLEVYGSAVVEHLVTMAGARLCAWADGQHMAMLPHYSPGYPEWEIGEQPRLLDLIRRGGGQALPCPIETLESGMLRPKKSLLAVFGVTPHVERVRPLTDLIPCENCSYLTCQYRRAPYRRAPASSDPELPAGPGESRTEAAPAGDAGRSSLDPFAKYTVNAKALERWSRDRLTLRRGAGGTTEAVFRYEGTTCTNMGRPLEFHYTVTLGPAAEGYPILAQRCAPAPADSGHTQMCGYISHRERLMGAIDAEAPLSGEPLNRVVGWARPVRSAGCYCDADSRQHKWGLVLETIHYALARQTAPGAPSPRQGADTVESTSTTRD